MGRETPLYSRHESASDIVKVQDLVQRLKQLCNNPTFLPDFYSFTRLDFAPFRNLNSAQEERECCKDF